MSSTQVGSIHYDLGLDTSKFDRAVSGISSKTKKIGDSMTNIGKKMTLGVTLPVVAGAAFAVKAASDLNETINKVDVAFKKQSKVVKEWSKTSINSMGLARQSALDAAALFGDMATSMGLNTDEAAKMSMGMVQLGADLASFKNISFAEAQTALAGVFTGETESLKRLGIVMTETNLEAYALAEGITKPIQEMSQAEKVQLRFKYIMEQTKNAQGDFSRTSQGTANQIRITQERFKELSATIGQKLLPFANQILTFLQGLIDKFSALSPGQQDFILKMVGIAAVLGPLLVVLGTLVKSVAALIPLFASPVFWVVAAVLAVVAGAVYLVWKNWDRLRPTFDAVVAKLKIVWAWFVIYILPGLKMVWSFMANQFAAAWRDIRASFEQARVALAPFMPQLKTVAKYFGIVALVVVGTFVAAIVLAIAVVAAIAVGLARLIGWAAKVVGAITAAGVAIWNWLGGLQSRVVGALAGAGSWLVRSGAAIIEGLIQGIMNKAGAVAGAVSSVLKKARDLLPSSPAKEGPFSGKGWTLYSGRSIMQGLAQGIKQSAALPQAALTSALARSSMVANVGMAMPNKQQAAGNETKIYGNVNIGSKQDADYFFNRTNRNQDVLSMGLAPMGGM